MGMSAPRSAAPPPAVGAMDRVVSAIDSVSTAAGWLAGWLIVPMTFAVAYEVAARAKTNARARDRRRGGDRRRGSNCDVATLA